MNDARTTAGGAELEALKRKLVELRQQFGACWRRQRRARWPRATARAIARGLVESKWRRPKSKKEIQP
jgi:hypothetical protein